MPYPCQGHTKVNTLLTKSKKMLNGAKCNSLDWKKYLLFSLDKRKTLDNLIFVSVESDAALSAIL